MSASGSSSGTQQVGYAGSKLYYTPTSCSASTFIVAHTLGLSGLQVEQVDLGTHQTKTGGKDFYTINPKGNVPTLVLPNGQILNETAAVLQFLADQKPEANLAGAFGSYDRYAVINALNHIASEVHPRLGAMFGANEQNKEILLNRAQQKLAYLEKEIKGTYYVLNRFTVADAYLHILLGWVQYFGKWGLTLDNYPNVKKYHAGIGALPNVQEALKVAHSNPSQL